MRKSHPAMQLIEKRIQRLAKKSRKLIRAEFADPRPVRDLWRSRQLETLITQETELTRLRKRLQGIRA